MRGIFPPSCQAHPDRRRLFLPLWYSFSDISLLFIKGAFVEIFLGRFSWEILVFACLTIGLAPFHPPHLWEKLNMLARGKLRRLIDWFDLFLHGAPWVLLTLKGIYALRNG
jgi:hypothetical protein